MNCLLIVPHCQDRIRNPYLLPIGLGYISAALKRTPGIEVINLNLNHVEGDPLDHLDRVLKNRSVDAVLAGGLYKDYHSLRAIFGTAKAHKPKLPTIMGGHIVSAKPEMAMRAVEFADYGVIGEGEMSVPALCLALKAGEPLKNLRGLIFKNENGLYERTPPEPEPEPELWPWCDYEGLGLDFYFDEYRPILSTSFLAARPPRSISLITSRSCPFKCTFCAHPSGVRYRERDLDAVFSELDFVTERFRPEFVAMADDMLGRSEARLSEFCRRIKEYGFRGWSGQFRIDQLTADKLTMIREAGCKSIALGLESADDEVLASMNKKLTVEKMSEGLALVEKAGLKVIGNFIFGDPVETVESSERTLKWWREHQQYAISLIPVCCYPGSAIYDHAVARGRIKDEIAFLAAGCPPINISKMSDAEYDDLIYQKLPEHFSAYLAALPEARRIRYIAVDYLKMLMTIEMQCSFCGATVRYENAVIMGSDLAWLGCRHCATRHRLPAIEETEPLAETVLENLDSVLRLNPKAAFWGIGKLFKALIDPHWIDRPEIYLVDRQSGGFWGPKKILPLEALSDIQPDCLIVPPDISPCHEEIVRHARENYGIETIMTLFELASPQPKA